MYSFDGLLGDGTVGRGTGPGSALSFVPPEGFFHDNTIPAEQSMTTRHTMTTEMN